MNHAGVNQTCQGKDKLTFDTNEQYEEAVRTLNTFQVLAEQKKNADKHRQNNVPNMIQYLSRLNIQLGDLDRLNVIHISGTKGKGSTCAFCESILRHQGYKTGFFSSPHLVETRERIQLNGRPVSKEKFVSYFWQVYNGLDKDKMMFGGKMPNYFSFLTVMAIYTFLKEGVDVAVLEVGIGGLYDATNVIKRPVVCGVTSLDLDHTSVLGNTIGSIAYHKSGIFKPGVPAVTVTQPTEAMEVMLERSREIKAPLYLAPPLSQCTTQGDEPQLGISGKKQKINSSLALQICRIWVDHYGIDENKQMWRKTMDTISNVEEIPVLNGMQISADMKLGLRNCCWPGRHQVLKRPGITFYISGAHTLDSLEDCAEWFREETDKERELIRKLRLVDSLCNGWLDIVSQLFHRRFAITKLRLVDSLCSGWLDIVSQLFHRRFAITCKTVKVLIFNATGDRSTRVLLPKLLVCDFDHAIFCPNQLNTDENKPHYSYLKVTPDTPLARAKENWNIWKSLLDRHGDENLNNNKPDPSEISPRSERPAKSENLLSQSNQGNKTEASGTHHEKLTESVPRAYLLPSVSDALMHACHGREKFDRCYTANYSTSLPCVDESVHIQILITGGHHLVGAALSILCQKMDIEIYPSM